ncbi:translation initiation factor IF-2 N-terminal domain-containing protein [Gordonia soli]|uniref:Ribonuclease E n=1 Tax=Gordonia soli NBRC 108243 TaxID=1223545 RepID=M0QL64_9ACTN|nr:translation initiation factor IF-2 N-terminal domain-containing protein [Gordonia soli]GAC69036.1 putative ribonuclease [Gordonia soli NBRC 108243]
MTENGSPADANDASTPADEFPSRLRVHALARTLGLTSRQVLAHLAELGQETRSPQSSIDREVAQAVADRVRAHVEVDETVVADPVAADSAVGATATAETAVGAQPEPADEPTVAEPEVDDPAVPAPAQVESAAPAPEPAAESAASDLADGDTQPSAPAAGGVPESAAPTEDGDKPAAAETAAPETAASEESAQRRTETPSLFSAASSQYDQPVVGGSDSVASGPLFLQPTPVDPFAAPAAKSAGSSARESDDQSADVADERSDTDSGSAAGDNDNDNDDSGRGSSRRRRRGRRGRGRGRGDQNGDDTDSGDESSDAGRATTDAGQDKGSGANDPNTENFGTQDSGTQDSGTQDSGSGTQKDAESEDKGSDTSRGGRSGRPSGKKGKKAKQNADQDGDDDTDGDTGDESADSDDSGEDGSTSKRRRRRRRRKGGGDSEDSSPDDPPNTVVHEREPRSKRARDEVQGISGSTRLEAKRQRRRDGRDAGRRRPPILSESEFLARREAVDRVMVVRERSANTVITDDDGNHEHKVVEDYTQVAVLEDGVLVEHFVTTATSSSMVGNIYLGRVQNVLPGMEAAFVDIGRGRNGVLYAGEVNWDAAGLDGGSRKIEQALKPGDNVLVQVSKDPVGHKGARLTTQISLAGRYLVYVPGGSSTGISRKLPDVERKRLKQILGKLVPEGAGVIIRTASEGVSAEELGADIARLESQWKTIDEAVQKTKKGSSAPQALYEEPDLLVRVVRDLFNEDFKKLVVEGPKAWRLVEGYVSSVAPDLMERVEQFQKAHADAPDSFVVHRVDEQLTKALDRKVWLPSGGTLIIEHTEAMTVVDVNTGKFTGSGGNLEETVTRNNLEAAEEIVRQTRLRDIGGMIIVDFIDMVLESNRDLVLRRLTEALARDRTRHQVSEVTSLGLVQMTRKRLGTGLLEAFSTTCTTCGGRGIIVHSSPVEVRSDDSGKSDGAGSKRSRRGRRKGETAPESKPAAHNPAEHPMFRAMAAHTHDDDADAAAGASDEASTASGDGAATSAADTTTTEDVSAADSAQNAAGTIDSSEVETSGRRSAGRRRRRRAGAPESRTATDEAASGTATEQAAGADAESTPDDSESSPDDDAVTAVDAAAGSTDEQLDERDIGESDTAESDADAGVADESGSDATAVDQAADDSSDAEAATSSVTDGASTAAAADEAGAAIGARRRRRVVRRAAAPTAAPDPVIVTADATSADDSAPVTTSGPIGAPASEPAVAVRRRPRRRAAGRPAGPPVDE